MIYKALITDKDKQFLKYGFTGRDAKERMKELSLLFDSVELLKTFEQNNIKWHKLELKLHRIYSDSSITLEPPLQHMKEFYPIELQTSIEQTIKELKKAYKTGEK